MIKVTVKTKDGRVIQYTAETLAAAFACFVHAHYEDYRKVKFVNLDGKDSDAK